MHPSTLPAELLARMTARRGRPYAFPVLDARRTALVVIDMQNAFVAPGAVAEVPAAREIVPNINWLARAVRGAGGRVVWAQTHVHPGDPGGGWPVFFGEIFSPELASGYIAALTRASEGHRLWSGLETEPRDLFAEKTRFSAFLPGACDLAERLGALGIDTVLIAGTLTNVCCESSARDAMMRGFRVVLVSDANATRNDAEHMASLVAIHQVFGDVRSSAETIALLERRVP
ncbi:MAG TPA: cysteine hydrolase [Burkholderiales bacterium]|nr:cysteine hydrolase [Burkholderiales bacterium]